MEFTKNRNNLNNSLQQSRKGLNPYKKINNKSTNSKYFSSSSKKLKNQIQDYTIDSENNKMLFYTEEENKSYQNLANEIRIQNKILEEYQNWVKTLLTVINNNKLGGNINTYDDIGTPIQQNLENIEKLKEENLKIKTLIINQKINNENMEKNIEKKQKTQNMVIKEFNDKDEALIEKTNKEKMQLTENVQMLANELDELNENNRQLNDKIIKDEKLNNIYNMVNLRNELKEENKLYKKIMVFNNRKNFIESNGTLQHNDSTLDFKGKKDNKEITINNKNTIHREYSIGPISGYGEYKLEKEENIHSNGSIFFCGL